MLKSLIQIALELLHLKLKTIQLLHRQHNGMASVKQMC